MTFQHCTPEGHPEINIAQRYKHKLQPKIETPTKQKLHYTTSERSGPF